MKNNKDESLLFASETMIFWVASLAKVVSWIVLVIYLILFVDSVKPMFQGQMQWPAAPADWITLVANVLFAPAMGLFYFLIMQGVAQGLNLGLDVFYELHPEADEEDEEEVVIVEEK